MTFKARILGFGATVCLFLLALVGSALLGLRERFQMLSRTQIAAKVQTTLIGREVNYVSRLTRNIMLGSDLDKRPH